MAQKHPPPRSELHGVLDERRLATRQGRPDRYPRRDSFAGDALCQVESVETKNRPCRNKHRNGCLGRRIDGKEGLIGSTCGPKYWPSRNEGRPIRPALL